MGKKQLHFDVDEAWLDELNDLQKIGGVRTKKELLNTALTILRYIANKRRTGGMIVFIDGEGNQTEFTMPYLEAVASYFKAS